MKKFFDLRLYLQGIKKVRVLGLIGLVTTSLFTLVNPILTFIQLSSVRGASSDELSSLEPITVPFAVISIPMLILLIFAPLLVSNIFSFLRKRSPSDFFHSLPHSKECMFISFFASCLTWVLATILITGGLAMSLYLAMPYPCVFDLWDVISSILGLFSLAFFLMGISAVAVSVTGTAFAWFACFAVIITAIPVYVSLFISSTSSLVPIVDYASSFVDLFNEEIGNIPASYLGNALSMAYPIYSPISFLFDSSGIIELLLIICLCIHLLLTNPLRIAIFILLGAGLTALGCFIYKKRLSEWSGKPMPNEKFRIALCCLLSLPFLLIATHYLLGFFMSAHSDTYQNHNLSSTITVMLVVALAVWFGAELITKKKLSSAVISFLRFPIVVGICVVYAAVCLCVRGSILSFKPGADDVAGVRFNDLGAYQSDYELMSVSDEFISDPYVIKYVCGQFYSNTYRYVENHTWANNMQTTSSVTFKMKSGATVTREVWFAGGVQARDILLLSLKTEDDYTKTIFTLPSNVSSISVSWLDTSYTDEQCALIWETFCEEYSEASFEEKAESKRIAFDEDNGLNIIAYCNPIEASVNNSFMDGLRVTHSYGVLASFVRTRQLMIEFAMSAPNYSGERVMSLLYDIVINNNSPHSFADTEPFFTVVSGGKELFNGRVFKYPISGNKFKQVCITILSDDRLMENLVPSADDSYVAFNIVFSDSLGNNRKFSTVFYAITDETAKTLASELLKIKVDYE